jgi:hypothetical protein
MKSTILIKIKWLNRYFNGLIVYFVCYNTYFGWNKKPLTDLETTFDDILKIGIYLGLGFILHIILSYIKFKMHKYSNDLRKELNG